MSRTQQLKDAIPEAPTSGAPANGKALMRKPDPARDLLASMEGEFAACLPKMLPVDLFMRVALTGFRKTPELLACSRRSVLAALLETARLGLEPCTEQAYLIPYKQECTLVIGYQGYVQLMYRTGQIDSVEAELIYEADEWEYSLGDGGRFFHRPNLLAEDRGQPVLAYSFATLRGGGRTKVAILTRRDAERIKQEYAKSPKSPWKTGHFDAMWLKSPVRQLQKWAPKSAEMRRALALDGATYDATGNPDVDPNVIPGEVVPEQAQVESAPPEPTTQQAEQEWPTTAQPPDGGEQS